MIQTIKFKFTPPLPKIRGNKMSEKKEKEKRVFLREATGLVREAGALDLLALASLNISWGLSAMWLFLWGPYYAPGGDLNLGITLVLVPMIFGALAWAFLASVMPRSGGDFIFNSRILHPLLGFLSSLGWICVNFIWCATLSAYVSSPALSMLAYTMGWTAIGDFVSSSMGIFVVATFVIVVSSLVIIWGIKPFLRLQLIMFAFGVLMFLIVWGLMATTTQTGFQTAWNSFSAKYDSGSFNAIINTAQTDGISWTPSLAASFALMPIAFWGLGYPYLATYLAGETKKVHRSALIGVPGGLILCGIFWYITVAILIAVVGYPFLTSVAYVGGNGLSPYAIPFLPMFHLFAAVLTENPILIFLLGWGFVAWNFMYAIYSILPQSRIALAWAFDRIAPSFFGDVSERFHTPVKSIILFAIGGEIVLFIYAFFRPPIIVSFTAMVPQILTTFLLTSIAAIVLPFRKKLKSVYEASPASKYKLGPIPFISICGVIYFSLLLFVLYYFFTNPGLGAIPATLSLESVTLQSLLVVVGIYIVGIIYYYAMRAHRKGQGIDIDLAFKELPPE